MPLDQLQKRRNLAARLVENSTLLMDALNNLNDLSSQYSAAGEQFVDDDFVYDGLRHLDANSASAVLSSATALKTWIDQNFHTTNFEKARP